MDQENHFSNDLNSLKTKLLDLVENKDVAKAVACASTVVRRLELSESSFQQYYTRFLDVVGVLGHLNEMFQESCESAMAAYIWTQSIPSIYSRLYLMITVGSVMVKKHGRMDVMGELLVVCKGIQEPIKGLVLRHYLNLMISECLSTETLDFVLENFVEQLKLWIRYPYVDTFDHVKKRMYERDQFRVLVEMSLAKLSQLRDLDMHHFRRLLAILLKELECCRDPDGQTLILQLLLEMFPNRFVMGCISDIVASFSSLDQKIDLGRLFELVIAKIDRQEQRETVFWMLYMEFRDLVQDRSLVEMIEMGRRLAVLTRKKEAICCIYRTMCRILARKTVTNLDLDQPETAKSLNELILETLWDPVYMMADEAFVRLKRDFFSLRDRQQFVSQVLAVLVKCRINATGKMVMKTLKFVNAIVIDTTVPKASIRTDSSQCMNGETQFLVARVVDFLWIQIQSEIAEPQCHLETVYRWAIQTHRILDENKQLRQELVLFPMIDGVLNIMDQTYPYTKNKAVAQSFRKLGRFLIEVVGNLKGNLQEGLDESQALGPGRMGDCWSSVAFLFERVDRTDHGFALVIRLILKISRRLQWFGAVYTEQDIYELIVSGLLVCEEAGFNSRTRCRAILAFAALILETNVNARQKVGFSDENYNILTSKLVSLAKQELRKPVVCRLLATCSLLYMARSNDTIQYCHTLNLLRKCLDLAHHYPGKQIGQQLLLELLETCLVVLQISIERHNGELCWMAEELHKLGDEILAHLGNAIARDYTIEKYSECIQAAGPTLESSARTRAAWENMLTGTTYKFVVHELDRLDTLDSYRSEAN